MINRIFKRIFVFAVIACLILACVPSVAFADVVEFTEAATAGAVILDLYGAVNNTSLAYDAISDSSALTEVITLYQDYSSSASDPYTLAAIGAAAAAAGCFAVVYDAVTGQGYIQVYQEEYISSLDGYWDYQLADLGLTRDLVTDLFTWPVNQDSSVSPRVLYNGNAWASSISRISPNASSLVSNGTPLAVLNSNNTLYAGKLANNNVYAFCYPSGSTYYFYVVSAQIESFGWGYVNSYFSNTTGHESSYPTGVFARQLTGSSAVSSILCPQFSSLSDALNSFASFRAGTYQAPSIYASPYFYVGDPLTAVPEITVPNPSSPDYTPSPSRINTNIEYDPSRYGSVVPSGEDPVPGYPYPITDPDVLNDLIPEIWGDIVAGDVTATETDPNPDPDPDPDPEPGPGPSEVFTPLLPVTLPSFNFSFSGIWHYVREWVSSLGAWFTTLFLIWSKLPYAMVVPVYATAVVVIVLGVYKRFFM